MAQAIPVLTSPILTRLYSPADFATLAIFMALVGTFTPLICGRYEVALVLPEKRVHAEHLLGVALSWSIGMAALLAALFLMIGDQFLAWVNAERIGSWILATPLALLMMGFYTAINYYANREKKYNIMSHSRVLRAFSATLVSIVAGYCGARFGGLLSGFISGLFIGTIYLFFYNRDVLKIKILKWGKAKKLLVYKYRHYPLYNATSGLIDGLTLGLPIFFMSRYFPESDVGNYSLVVKVSLAPVSFISVSISQLNLKKVVDIVNVGKSPIPYLLKLTALLFGIAVLPATSIMIWGEEFFTLLFGEQWSAAGEYAQILMPAFLIQFISSTLSTTLGATNSNKLAASWKFVAFISTASIFLIFSQSREFISLLQIFAINNVILYLLYYAAIIYGAHRPKRVA